ncbi:transposase IS116/IS110/IS902 family protein [Antarctobacter heliothermus]|uniref:Transposase IS116/IS110/IS902 family protein n=1 Tax=Antarctobacter heliothermus TaxID=74033 RepID=A0A222E2Q5_9RHOB|nr:transposase IS116/IS110/IS902 family protein [Antarctobacter heliothermus]ASP20499.1 transposase IS116/IS110/IS902 family protein [Antarctobacter heliothermus]ASP21546.1 transposase IS116/IS110/IS902 family protein [Antarctobacter heliothermus]ASP22573.1 transposase IS116/IS110/IS902 family protein [Antarctobacter heliothermus]
MQVTTVGLDLAKNIFHVHGVTETGDVAFNRPLRRAQVLAFFQRLSPCLVGIEACASSHHWARELSKLGHTVRLMPPMYVKPYVKRGKSDAVDAEAICEAVTRPRPTMRFVEIKSKEQQALLSLHRARDFVVRQRTQLINMVRSLAAEFGITIARGVARAIEFAKSIIDGKQPGPPDLAQDVLRVLSRQLIDLHNRLGWFETMLRIQARLSRQAQLLQTIPGVGPVTASAVAATIGSGRQFRSGREFSAWLGLTPRNHSSGGKERLGKITKMGDRYLRQLIVVGMTSRVRQVAPIPSVPILG